ncbi:MAG: transposase [Nitrososphaerales archaeon]|nr:transposase [Nitrososphaerales archaeon]
MRSTISVKFCYRPSADLSSLFEDFRLMCNDAIGIALKENPKNRFGLIESAYPRLKEYGLHTHYILSACEVAYSVYRNKNRKSDPYIEQAFIKLDNQTYTLNHLLLRIPIRPREFVHLTLQGSDYHLSFIEEPTLKRGSVTITDRTISLAVSKEVVAIEPLGNVGIDVNERNVTASDTLGNTKVYDTSQVAEVRETYRAIKAKIGHRTRQDRRVGQRLYSKYGKREKDRTIQALHRVSKAIVEHARNNRLGIRMEKLKGIRKLYRKGNGQGTSYRGRMNSWTFHEVQRQVEYKAAWLGVPVSYVNPRGTSRNCAKCHSRMESLEDRRMLCPCGRVWDRDVNASRNIMMACAVPQARSPKGSSEGERDDDGSNPQSRLVEVRSSS